jgi:hypothetical protein
MKNIYENDQANVYLAKYFPFVYENKNHPIIREMIHDGLHNFFDLHILSYTKYKETNINFIGSVAYFLSNEINKIAKEKECKIGKIIQKPIKGLINFHTEKMIS